MIGAGSCGYRGAFFGRRQVASLGLKVYNRLKKKKKVRADKTPAVFVRLALTSPQKP